MVKHFLRYVCILIIYIFTKFYVHVRSLLNYCMYLCSIYEETMDGTSKSFLLLK